MLAISVELLHGTLRADPSGAANTGNLARGEWPPAPYRLFAAFVAAGGTPAGALTAGQRCLTNGAELEWLEMLPAPRIHADADPSHQILEPRYVVLHARGPQRKSTHQEYPARKGALVRPGVRVAPRDPRVIYCWPNTAPPTVLHSLRLRAARIGYLGASDSPVRVRVAAEHPQKLPGEEFVPDPDGDLLLGITRPGHVRILDGMFKDWSQRGASVSRSHYPALRHEAAYRHPRSRPKDDPGKVVAWLRLETPISGRRVSALTAVFKEAVLSKYQALHGEPPAVLHGHGFRAKGYEIARYLALPDVGSRWSRGRIHGLAIWTPPGWSEELRRRTRDAAYAVRRLRGNRLDVAVMVHGREKHPWASNPKRWRRRSRGWATAFPAIHERRRTLDLPELRRWCRHAGLPAPIRFRSARKPLVRGAVDLAPVQVNRPNRPGRPYSHLELWFEEPVRGPVVIGSGRQRGLGLCVPLSDPADDQSRRARKRPGSR